MKQLIIILLLSIPLISTASNSEYDDLSWEDMAPVNASKPRKYSLDELHNFDKIIAAEDIQNAELLGRQVVTELAGKKVKLPAYVVPLEQDDNKISAFLLVPYFGACIHVPPPPPNQIVFGTSKDGIKSELFDAVWVYGTLQIETINSELAEAGYSMKVDKVEPMEIE